MVLALSDGSPAPRSNSPPIEFAVASDPETIKMLSSSAAARRHASPTRNAEEGEAKGNEAKSTRRAVSLAKTHCGDVFRLPSSPSALPCLLSSAVNGLMLRRRALSFRGRR